MRKILFFLVSAFIAGTTYATNLSKDIVAKITNSNETSVIQKDENLILDMPINKHLKVYTHGSHGSHRSHWSHRSHYSSRFY